MFSRKKKLAKMGRKRLSQENCYGGKQKSINFRLPLNGFMLFDAKFLCAFATTLNRFVLELLPIYVRFMSFCLSRKLSIAIWKGIEFVWR
jgi:hypothetical protein